MQLKKWNNIILVLLTILAILFVVNKLFLKPKYEQAISTAEEVLDSLPSEFWQFYEQFHTDSAFQLQHIAFPLSGIAVNDSSDNEYYTWQPADWTLHQPIDDLGSGFEQEFVAFGNMVEETIKAKNYNFSMSRRFAKLGDEYNLIYYKEMGPN